MQHYDRTSLVSDIKEFMSLVADKTQTYLRIAHP